MTPTPCRLPLRGGPLDGHEIALPDVPASFMLGLADGAYLLPLPGQEIEGVPVQSVVGVWSPMERRYMERRPDGR
jgi:hypothetical protein